MGEITLSTSTLVPLGSLAGFVAAVWYMSTKVSEIKDLQKSDAEAKKILEDAVRKADFDKHVAEDLVKHASDTKDLAEVKNIQARDGERWINVEKLLTVIQQDLNAIKSKRK